MARTTRQGRAGPEPIDSRRLRRIVADSMAHAADETHGDHRLNPQFRDWVVDRAVTAAAVLIPLVERRGELMVVLTRRPDHMKSHSGQVAFPGGKIDPADPSAEAAALREAQEEIALDPSHVEVLGRLPDYHTGSGYRIAPVIALVDAGAEFVANPDEVDYVFEVPLAFLMDPANHHRGTRIWNGRERHFFEMPYDEHYIWGVTAGILRMMQERLFA